MKSENLQRVKRGDLHIGVVLYYSDAHIVYGTITKVLVRECRILCADGTKENQTINTILGGHRMAIVPDTSGFDNAKAIAFEVPAGTFRRAKDAEGCVSNFMGYKSWDGQRFFVMADSYKDLPNANLLVNRHPAVEVFKP